MLSKISKKYLQAQARGAYNYGPGALYALQGVSGSANLNSNLQTYSFY